MMPNVLQYPVAIAAILRAGYVVVNVNPLYTPRELEHQLKDSGAEAIILLENFAVTLQAIVRNTSIKHVVVAAMGDLMGIKGTLVNFVVRKVKKMVPAWSLPGHVKFNDAIAEGARQSFKPVQQGPDDVAFLQYTGGTTGVAKGATLLHRNLIANVLQSEIWLDPVRANRTDIDQFVTVVALPLYHVFALTVCGLLTIRTGGLGVLIPNPRDIPRHDQGAGGLSDHDDSRRQHAVQRAAEQSGFPQARFLEADRRERRRHGGAGSRRQALVRADAYADHRRLRVVGDVAVA